MYAYIHIYMCVFAYCNWVYTHTHTYICTYAMFIYTHTHRYMYIFINIPSVYIVLHIFVVYAWDVINNQETTKSTVIYLFISISIYRRICSLIYFICFIRIYYF